MEKSFTHTKHFSRTNPFRSLLVVAFLCIASAFFTPATPTAHAATSPLSSIIEALRKAGYTQVMPHSNPGTYQFTDNLYSAANKMYVSTELGATGNNYAMLRARSNTAGPWETYNWYAGFTKGTYEIQSQANGLYVAAEFGGTGIQYAMLRARTSSSNIGSWEQFYMFTYGGCNPIQSNCLGEIIAANTLYVSVGQLSPGDIDYGMLSASTYSTDAPELKFYI